ncbi:AAA family ATPase [Spirosoma panaciterrae]|uniref:AAA family ATPase n=1 Tax=Spirosoma panaciterrae TaxID=496058 RepID=UPI000381A468|nr:AAA family ATPase [Spirosoma panaciterrae]
MQIKRLVIENFKSIERIELIEPNPFTVFVGPNGSGKSNIFEALEFVNISYNYKGSASLSLFGGLDSLQRRQDKSSEFGFRAEIGEYALFSNSFSKVQLAEQSTDIPRGPKGDVYRQFMERFSRLFVKNESLEKFRLNDSLRLSLSAKNLEKVLKRVLANENLRDEIFEWLDLFVPGFKSVEVDDRDELHWFEDSVPSYFTKDLISDGTYNILAMLAAVYQSDEPQFLCIEEPENGLHPQVLMTLVDFFRSQCNEKGHFIWLNTHSESLVRCLTTDEIVLVNKKDGATTVKQIKDHNFYDLPTDEAWLTGALGGGLPW